MRGLVEFDADWGAMVGTWDELSRSEVVDMFTTDSKKKPTRVALYEAAIGGGGNDPQSQVWVSKRLKVK